jgi:hypothetical protein
LNGGVTDWHHCRWAAAPEGHQELRARETDAQQEYLTVILTHRPSGLPSKNSHEFKLDEHAISAFNVATSQASSQALRHGRHVSFVETLGCGDCVRTSAHSLWALFWDCCLVVSVRALALGICRCGASLDNLVATGLALASSARASLLLAWRGCDGCRAAAERYASSGLSLELTPWRRRFFTFHVKAGRKIARMRHDIFSNNTLTKSGRCLKRCMLTACPGCNSNGFAYAEGQ